MQNIAITYATKTLAAVTKLLGLTDDNTTLITDDAIEESVEKVRELISGSERTEDIAIYVIRDDENRPKTETCDAKLPDDALIEITKDLVYMAECKDIPRFVRVIGLLQEANRNVLRIVGVRNPNSSLRLLSVN